MKSRLLALGLCFALGACVSGSPRSLALSSASSTGNLKTPEKYFSALDRDDVQLASDLAGKTIMTFDGGHGTQIAYFSPEGVEYLWYPGNAGVVRGDWRTEPSSAVSVTALTTQGKVKRRIKSAKICFRYGNNTYNPVTRSPGGRFQCRNSLSWLARVADKREGDIFKLSSRPAPPYRLSLRPTSFDELLSKCAYC